jgi:hypothetical protein
MHSFIALATKVVINTHLFPAIILLSHFSTFSASINQQPGIQQQPSNGQAQAFSKSSINGLQGLSGIWWQAKQEDSGR